MCVVLYVRTTPARILSHSSNIAVARSVPISGYYLRFYLFSMLLLSLPSALSSTFFFFFNDPPTPEIYPLPLHAALPISCRKLCPIPAAGPANLATTPARGTRLLRLRSLAHPCTHVHCPHAVGQSLSYRFRGKLVCGPVLSASHLRQRGHGHARLGGRARA